MDISFWNKNRLTYANQTIYSKAIGEYRLYVYLGVYDNGSSLPEDTDLDINQYTQVITEIRHVGMEGYPLLNKIKEIDDLNLRYYNLKDYVCYFASVQELEQIYNILNNLVGITKTNLVKEKPCKSCGKLNDIGAPVCWSFNCGVNNPTG